jgi:hypothetical protein
MTRIHNERDSDHWLSKIINLWPIILAAIGIITMATTFKNRLDAQTIISQDHENRIRNLEANEETLDAVKADTGRLIRELIDKGR